MMTPGPKPATNIGACDLPSRPLFDDHCRTELLHLPACLPTGIPCLSPARYLRVLVRVLGAYSQSEEAIT